MLLSRHGLFWPLLGTSLCLSWACVIRCVETLLVTWVCGLWLLCRNQRNILRRWHLSSLPGWCVELQQFLYEVLVGLVDGEDVISIPFVMPSENWIHRHGMMCRDSSSLCEMRKCLLLDKIDNKPNYATIHFCYDTSVAWWERKNICMELVNLT